MKWCPILKAGTLLVALSSTSNYPIAGEIKLPYVNAIMGDAQCVGNKCEWYENGCPAHLNKRDKLEPPEATSDKLE